VRQLTCQLADQHPNPPATPQLSSLPTTLPQRVPATPSHCISKKLKKRKWQNTHYRERHTFGPLITCGDTRSTLQLTHQQQTIWGSNQQTLSEWTNFIYGIREQEVQLYSHWFLSPGQTLWCVPRGCQQGAWDDWHTTSLSLHMGGSQLNLLICTHCWAGRRHTGSLKLLPHRDTEDRVLEHATCKEHILHGDDYEYETKLQSCQCLCDCLSQCHNHVHCKRVHHYLRDCRMKTTRCIIWHIYTQLEWWCHQTPVQNGIHHIRYTTDTGCRGSGTNHIPLLAPHWVIYSERQRQRH
jgi:hypothetical protein